MIEKNIVFIHPLSNKLQELFEYLSQDDDLMIFEIDSLAEYGQIIGVLEHSVTFSSDLKKTKTYLQDFQDFVKGKTAKNILVQSDQIDPFIKGKLKTQGLNEIVKEDTKLEVLAEKALSFFDTGKGLPTLGASAGIAGNSPTFDDSAESSNAVEANKISIDNKKSNMFDFDSNKKRKSVDFQFQSQFSNFKLKKNKTDMSFLNNKFDNLQRKDVLVFTPKLKELDLKKIGFQPVSGELKRNPYQKSLELVSRELKSKKRGVFTEVDRLKPKSKKLGLPELQRKLQKRPKFEPVMRKGPERKKFDLPELKAGKKKKGFEEVQREIGHGKGQKSDELNNLQRNLKSLDLPGKKKDSRRGKFEEVDRKQDNSHGNGSDEFNDLEGKINNLDLPGRKAKEKESGTSDEEAPKDKKKGHFEEVEREIEKKKHANISDEFSDLSGEIGSVDEASEREKKKKNQFSEVERDSKKQQNFEEVKKEMGQLKGVFDENLDELEKKKKANFEEVKKEKKNKKSDSIEDDSSNLSGSLLNFEEVKKNRKIESQKQELSKEEYELILEYTKDKKIGDPTVLDYRKLHKEYKEGKFELQEELAQKILRKHCEKLAEEEEFDVFPYESYGLEFLILYLDILLASSSDNQNLFKFCHFALAKEFDGEVSFYQNKGVEVMNLYQGHKGIEDFEAYEREHMENWNSTDLPQIKDETFQVENNQFLYPFYEEGKKLGFAVANLRKNFRNHQDARKAELLLSMVKGVYFEN